MSRIDKPNSRRFVRRLLGASTYHRLERAFKADAAVCFVGARRALRSSLTYAAAVEECLNVLSEHQLAELPGLADLRKGSLVDARQLEELEGTFEEIATSLRANVSRESLREVEELSETLVRKLQGARDALDYSADAASQAANSLIELIDRTLREAFDDTEVLAWVDEHCADRRSALTWADAGRELPTKRAQALRFTFAGGPIGEGSLIQEAAAMAITQVRHELQALKHADLGSDEEKALMMETVLSVESYFILVVRFAWLARDEAALRRVRSRLSLAP